MNLLGFPSCDRSIIFHLNVVSLQMNLILVCLVIKYIILFLRANIIVYICSKIL